MNEWQLVFHGPTLEFLLSRKPSTRLQLLGFCDALKANPYAEADYLEADLSGRPMNVRLVGEWAVTYWRDELVKEIRVVKIEPA